MGARVRIVSRYLPPHLRAMVVERGHEFRALGAAAESDRKAAAVGYLDWLGVSQEQDAEETANALGDRTWDWLVVDHYALDAQWETVLRQGSTQVLAIDDLANRPHNCDMLLDQNHYEDGATRYLTLLRANCRLLLGPRYSLLREEFSRLRSEARPRKGGVNRILVSFGGVDAVNYTSYAVEALHRLGPSGFHVEADVVVGAGHPRRGAVENACVSAGFTCHVQTTQMGELMARADIAIGAGGTAIWERCCLGLPSLVMSIADNQRRQIADAALEGWIYAPEPPGDAAEVLPWMERHLRAFLENAAWRECMSRAGMAAVDGRGATRVVRELASSGLEIRRATIGDSRQLFAWRNHPSVRQASCHSEPLEWSRHEEWLAVVLADPDRVLLLVGRPERPVGVVRFDIEQGSADVSIYLVPEGPATATGAEVLRRAEQWLVASRADVHRFRALVLGDNLPSHRLFAGGGYDLQSTWYVKTLNHQRPYHNRREPTG